MRKLYALSKIFAFCLFFLNFDGFAKPYENKKSRINNIIVAIDDEFSSTPLTSNDQTQSIFDNDTFNGSTINSSLISISSNNIPAGLTINSDGTILISSNVVSGSYFFNYQICETAVPSNCSSATVTIVVENPIDAVDDVFSGLFSGQTTSSFLNNDTLDGSPVVLGANFGEVSLTYITIPNEITGNPDGTISINPNTPSGTYSLIYEICENGASPPNCDMATINLVITSKKIKLKAILQGAAYNSTDNLMRDDLRVNNLIPTTEPYSSMFSQNIRFIRPDFTVSETIGANLLTTNGNDAIVDWIFIELRNPNNIYSITHTKLALIQRDGDIVNSEDGSDLLTFNNLSESSYYVAIKHRNHLAVLTNSPIVFFNGILEFDFTNSTPDLIWNSSLQYNGNEQILLQTGKYALWAGDSNSNGIIKYLGFNSDSGKINNDVMNITNNSYSLNIYNNGSGLYSNADINLDGKIKNLGFDNDVNYIHTNVLINYNLNTYKVYDYSIFKEQIPQ